MTRVEDLPPGLEPPTYKQPIIDTLHTAVRPQKGPGRKVLDNWKSVFPPLRAAPACKAQHHGDLTCQPCLAFQPARFNQVGVTLEPAQHCWKEPSKMASPPR